MSRQWDNSLFGCFSDCGTCCYGFWCTCCLAGSNAQRLEKAKGDPDAGCCAHCCIWYILACFCCQGCYECSTTRKDMRKRYSLEGDDASACLAHTFCAGCALCQDAREIQYQEATGGANAPVVTGMPMATPPVEQEMAKQGPSAAL